MSGTEDMSERSGYVENDLVSMDAATSITFRMGSGTDNTTDRYLNLPQGIAYGIEVIPTVACSISEINGRTFKSPISVGTLGYRTNHMKVTRLTIVAGSATVVEVGGKC